MVLLQTLAPIELRSKKSKLRTAFQILSSPKTTIALAGTLGALLLPGGVALKGVKAVGRFVAPKTLKGALIGAVAVPTLIGALTTPFGRKIGKEVFDPRKGFARGKGIGKLPTAKEKTLGELVTKLGLAGLLIGTGALVGKKAIGLVATGRRKAPLPIPVLREPVLTKAIPIIPIPPTPSIEPIGVVKQPVPKEMLGVPKPVTIRNIFKPEVNISFRKSRRFINQQNIIKT